MSKIIRNKTFGLVSIRKVNSLSYRIDVPNLRKHELKAFETSLCNFARSFNNVAHANRLKVPLKGVA